jgi:hypothetical protein
MTEMLRGMGLTLQYFFQKKVRASTIIAVYPSTSAPVGDCVCSLLARGTPRRR